MVHDVIPNVKWDGVWFFSFWLHSGSTRCGMLFQVGIHWLKRS